jgi:hypothetical protein
MKKWLEYLVSVLFSNRKCRGLSPWLGRPWLLQLMVNQGAWGGGSSSELGLAGHSGAWELASRGRTERGEHGDPDLGLTGALATVERRCDGGDEWWGLELSVRATKGASELKREGKRDGEGQRCSSPFIGTGGRRRWEGKAAE